MGNGRWAASKEARAAKAGVGTSFGAHTVLGLLIWTGVAGSGRVKGVDVGSGEMGTVAVGVIDDLPPAAPEPPPTLATPPQQRPQRATVAARRKSPPSAKVPVASATSTVSAPAIAPIKSPSEALTPAPIIVPNADAATPPSGVQAALPPGPHPTGPEGTTAPRPAPPAFVEAEVATYLRSQDYFPSLPSSLRARGTYYQARLDICVSREGRVVDVGFRQAAAPALDSVLASAVRGWRYRPLMVNGAPAPFCHRMTVKYETM